MTQIEKHEKAIRLLNAITECDRIIAANNKQLAHSTEGNKGWLNQRIQINIAMKWKMENYYNKSFKI